MKQVTPKAILVAETAINDAGFKEMLESIGVPEWTTDTDGDAEMLVESAGKLCYMSFDTKLNKNLTKVGGRDNFDYLQEGIIGTKHGSVLEHATVTFAMLDVSRVYTHELVRHRVGSAYSQTSGRYVRTDELGFFIPSVIKENPDLEEVFINAVKYMEDVQLQLAAIADINGMTARGDFDKKKKLTSAFRRLIGNGQANNIMATYNHRALRHLIELRTSRHAEEEIRLVFEDIHLQMREKFPAFYADAESKEIDGILEVTFKHQKV